MAPVKIDACFVLPGATERCQALPTADNRPQSLGCAGKASSRCTTRKFDAHRIYSHCSHPIAGGSDLGTLDELELVLPQPSNVPEDGSEISRTPQVIQDLLTGRARLAIAAGGSGAQPLDDRHPAILAVCFPASFPYGLSGQRPFGMSYGAYCKHVVRRVPRAQFSGNAMLLARMYDILVRQQTMAQVGVSLRIDPRLNNAAARVPRDAVRAMGDILALPYRHPQRRRLLAEQSPLVQALVEGTRMSTLRIDLTDAFYNGAQATMRAAAMTIGWPPLFFNLNPADMHAAAAVIASGQVLELNDDGRPRHVPSTVEKWRRVKEDPYSCAALLVATKEVLVEHLFGFAPGAMTQTNPHCLCGVTFEVAVKVEQSGRLALHLHGIAHVAVFAIDRLQQLFSGPNCRALALAHALCEAWYPSPYYDPSPACQGRHVFGMPGTEAATHRQEPPAIDSGCPPAAYDFTTLAGCAGGGAPPASRHMACRRHHAAVVRSTLTHTHNDTCKRHGCRGTDDSCGMAFPRRVRPTFEWVGTAGLFALPRLGPNIVPHCAAVALAFGCNQLFSLACEVDRSYALGASEEEQPIAIDHARDAAYYSTKYTAKVMSRSQAARVCTAVSRVQDFLTGGASDTASRHVAGDECSAFRNLCIAAHRMTATITVGMALAAFKLAGYNTFETTITRSYLPVAAFTALATSTAIDSDDALADATLVDMEDCNGYALLEAVQNYILRGPELDGLDCSPYVLAANYATARVSPDAHPHASALGSATRGRGRKRRAQNAAAPDASMMATDDTGGTQQQPATSCAATTAPLRVAFQPEHPHYLTHVLHRHARPRYVLLGGALPRRPGADTSAEDADRYYAFVLSIFKAHRGSPVPTGHTIQEAYDTWWAELDTCDAGRRYQQYVRVLLDNIEEDHAARARHTAEYNRRRREQRATDATDVCQAGTAGSDAEPNEDQEAEHARFATDPDTCAADDDDVERYHFQPGRGLATSGLDLATLPLASLFDRTCAAGLYAYDAAARCRLMTLPNGHGMNCGSFIRRARHDDAQLLAEAAKRLKRYHGVTADRLIDDADADYESGQQLRLQGDGTPHRPLTAIVYTSDGTEQVIPPGRTPPYIRLQRPPSIDETIQLFTLAPEQAVPLMLLAQYFDRRNEPNPGAPPRMLVIGPPGTGKSQFVHALLWYTFQHGQPDWPATCAYSWAAATAFNTSVHRSLSTHAMFGISATGGRKDQPKRGGNVHLQVSTTTLQPASCSQHFAP